MATTILVAGATGDLGGRIIKALLNRGAQVRALVRSVADTAKIAKIEEPGVKIIPVVNWSGSELASACEGVSCVVSAVQGLRDVIVDAQCLLLDAAISAGVPRFIPSDFASDFTKLPAGSNRNFDLRREFNVYLDKSSINATSIHNGAFAELLKYNISFLNFKDKTIGYLGSPDWRVDFSTMDNTAAYTAAAALDALAPRVLRIASFQISAKEMAVVAGEVLKTRFELVNMGTCEALDEKNRRDRAAHPESEKEIYPNWQRGQYMHSMFSVQLNPLDTSRYPDIRWTSVKEVLL